MKLAIAGVIVGFILLFVVPWWVGALVIAAALALPVTAYLMLDPSQRRRVRRIQQRRREIGRGG
jgi:Flp pilus assembly protein TadB